MGIIALVPMYTMINIDVGAGFMPAHIAMRRMHRIPTRCTRRIAMRSAPYVIARIVGPFDDGDARGAGGHQTRPYNNAPVAGAVWFIVGPRG